MYLASGYRYIVGRSLHRVPTSSTLQLAAVCGIDGDPATKNNPKAEYVLEGRPYYAEFDDDS